MSRHTQRVAILHPAFSGVGGAELLAISQAKCLHEQGFDVCMITSTIDQTRWHDEFRGLRTELLGASDWLDELAGRETWIARRVKRLEKLLVNIDVAVAHNYPMSRMLAHANTNARKIWYCNEPFREIHLDATHPTLAKRADSGIPAATSAEKEFARHRRRQRDSWLGIRSKRVSEGLRDLATVDKLELICPDSNFACTLATRTYGSRPYRVLYPVVRFPESWPSRHGLDRSELRILVQTRLTPEKNVDTILRGFAAFLAGARSRAQLYIVGNGPCSAELHQLAKELNIEAATHFCGFVSDQELIRIHEMCEVFVLLSIDEPFGLVFPEAAARGLLLVGPDHGGPFEILEQGRLGFTTDPFAPEQLASALERVMSLSDVEVDRLRVAADESCRDRFSASTITPQMISTYELT